MPPQLSGLVLKFIFKSTFLILKNIPCYIVHEHSAHAHSSCSLCMSTVHVCSVFTWSMHTFCMNTVHGHGELMCCALHSAFMYILSSNIWASFLHVSNTNSFQKVWHDNSHISCIYLLSNCTLFLVVSLQASFRACHPVLKDIKNQLN